MGIRLAAKGLAFQKTYEGQITAIDHLCAAIPRDASVVFIGGTGGGGASRLTQVVRGMCDVPTANVGSVRIQAVEQVVRGITRAGRRPVFLADNSARLAPYGGRARLVMRLRSTMDENALSTGLAPGPRKQ